ncbi:MAG: hypothetical protein ACFE0Q_03145 [Anaerolineae bacterium]
MDGFLVQFIAQAWRGILLIVVLLIGIAFLAMRERNKARRDRQQKRQELDGSDQTAMTPSPSASPPATSVLDELVDEEEDEDPLAELYAVRAEAEKERARQQRDAQAQQPAHPDPSPAPLQQPQAEEEAVDLASLLTNMVQSPPEVVTYHTIAEQTVAVKLVTQTHTTAREQLTILRDERDKRLLVQIADRAYRTLVNHDEAKRTFTAIMKELSGMIMTADDAPPADVDISAIAPNKMTAEPLPVRVANGGEAYAREMISILRDERDGRLLVQIGNTGYRTLNGHDRAKIGFAKIMKELATIVTTPDDNPPPVTRALAISAPSVSPTTPIPDAETVLPGDIRVAKITDLPDAYETGFMGRIKPRKIKPEERVEELSIAEAIEAYLQYKIDHTPAFQNRGIHIRSAFGGGVRIDVDGKSYEFVDEIEDDQARAFIKQAIDEWQDRH